MRRLEPLPEGLVKPRIIATVLAICVSEEDAEIDRLSSIFKQFGTIQQMRIVRPDIKLPTYLQVRKILESYTLFNLPRDIYNENLFSGVFFWPETKE